MKQLVTTFMCFVCISNYAHAQSPISNVSVKVSDEKDKVTIYYDLQRNSRIPMYVIKTVITLDGEKIEVTGLTGDIGSQVTAGLGKKIIWDVHQDLTELSGELKIEVLTDTKSGTAGPCVPIKTLPAYAGLGSIALSGIGVLVLGISKENESKDLYDVYKNNLDPSAQVFTDANLSREEHYSDANKKHKQAQWIMAGGAAIVVAGGYILVDRLIKIKKYNKECAKRSTSLNRMQIQPNVAFVTGKPSYGAYIQITF